MSKETRHRPMQKRDGTVVNVYVTVDWDDLFNRVGYKAICNKAGKAEVVHGAVKAKCGKS